MKRFDHIVVDLSGLYLDESFYFIEQLDREIDKNIRFIVYNPENLYSNILFTSREIIDLNNIEYNTSITMIGCLIESIKNSKYTISMNFSEAAHLSLLLKTKLHLYREFSEDFINKINPFNTSVYYKHDKNEGNFKLCE